eukprot:CAMPEP_0170072096 /NCGR_PEP_ID=MMETSP0019_2-20121128/9815_1 /TAXON_ID=98059 /ORGANISM="Dinobryon sp., Strain UTEXLB2267" /LENGTH=257 /DNA_ID=CAMNT_0010280887 /DNA_START=181 /DNA_END=954 /DNA_ORIENTATION=-
MIRIIFVINTISICLEAFNQIPGISYFGKHLSGERIFSEDSFSTKLLDKSILDLKMIQKRTNRQLAQLMMKYDFDLYNDRVVNSFRKSFIKRFNIPSTYVVPFTPPRIFHSETGDLVVEWDSVLSVDYENCTEADLFWPPSNSFYFLEIEQNADDYDDDYDDDNLTELFQNVECKVKQTFGAIYGLGVPVHIDIMRRTSYQRAFFKPLLKDAIVNVIICTRNNDESKTKMILNEGFIALVPCGDDFEWFVPNKIFSK